MTISPRTSRLALLWTTIVAFVLAMIAAGAAFLITKEARLLANEGKMATATIVAKRYSPRSFSTSSVRGRLSDWTITYRFSVDGKTFQRSYAVDRERFEAITQGEHVPVRYLPGDPSFSEIEQDWNRQNGFWAAGFAISFFLLGLMLAFTLRRLPRTGI